MTEPQSVSDYDDRGIRAAHAVLVEIGQILGSYKDGFVVVGGAVPALVLPTAEPRHIGTTDIDLGLDPLALSGKEYVGLIEALEKRGYVRGQDDMKRFQLRREVDLHDGGPPVAVIVDLLMPREAKPPKNKPPLLSEFAVQKADGVGTALQHCFEVDITGEMPDGRKNTVRLRVASIPAFLVMKGHALVGRDKKKDAYDIYYSIRNFQPTLDALVKECRELAKDPKAAEAYRAIAAKFSAHDEFGPMTVRQFLQDAGGMGDMNLEEVQTDAFQQVSAWAEGVFAIGEV